MDYSLKYIKYKKKYIALKNLYGGINDYQILHDEILLDFFSELNKYTKEFNELLEDKSKEIKSFINFIEKLKVSICEDNIIYKNKKIKIDIKLLNFYNNFILLLNFIITHTVYYMLYIIYNISNYIELYSENYKIPYLEDYKYNHFIEEKTLLNDFEINSYIIKNILNDPDNIINILYKNEIDKNSYFDSIYTRDNMLVTKTENKFKFHKYKLFLLLNSKNTRIFCFKTKQYINNLPYYDINDFKYLLLFMYYLKYMLCIKEEQKSINYKQIFELINEYIFFDINKSDIEQYDLLFL